MNRSPVPTRSAALLAALLVLSLAQVLRADDPPAAEPPVHGITISCPTMGREWGSDDMVATMGQLRALGANWITIHPYAGIGRDGHVRNRSFADVAAPPDWLTRPIAEAHRLGLKIMIKPHLAYWGRFTWRGEIEFATDAEWRIFFAEYEDWIVKVAAMSRGADAFVVGCELDRTLGFEDDWRRIIAGVRACFPGPLTYAANWSDYERVPFWDALDVVGIQAYFPLLPLPQDGPGPAAPDAPALDAAWTGIMERLRDFGRAHRRRICFTELGYNHSARAPYEPWDYAVGGPDATAAQERCLAAALAAIAREPTVCGAFLWKCFPGRARPRDFDLMTPSVRDVIARHWTAPAHAPRDATPAPIDR